MALSHLNSDNNQSSGKPVTTEHNIDRMGTGSVSKLIIEFSIPSIVSLVISALYSFVDGIFIGYGVGDVGIAGSTVSYPLVLLTLAVAMLFGGGGNALAALRLGEGNKPQANVILGNTVTLSVVVSLGLFLVCLPFIDPILWFCGGTEESVEVARPYALILLAGGMFQCISVGVANFIRTAGAPNRAMGIMLIGAVVNVALDYLFVILFRWGMVGAGLATVVGQAISAFLVLWYFRKRNGELRIERRNLKLRSDVSRGILFLGIASFIFEFATAVVIIVMNRLFVQYGGADAVGANGALAAMGVIERISNIFYLPLIGIAQGMQPILGYNYGAGNWKRVRKTFWYSVLFGTVVIIALWAVVEGVPQVFINMFSLDESVMSFAVWGLRVYMIMCPILGFEVIGSNYYQATGQAGKAALLMLLRQVLILIPLLYLFPVVLPMFTGFSGVQSIFIAIATCDAISTVVVGVFIFFEMRKVNRHCLEPLRR